MRRTRALMGIGGLLLGAVVAAMVGCESTETTASVIAVSPSAPELHGVGTTQTFTASVGDTNSVLNLPLVWEVSDTRLGVILASEGVTAVYQSTGVRGNNIVTVRDQGEMEGMAVVTQR